MVLHQAFTSNFYITNFYITDFYADFLDQLISHKKNIYYVYAMQQICCMFMRWIYCPFSGQTCKDVLIKALYLLFLGVAIIDSLFLCDHLALGSDGIYRDTQTSSSL